MLIWPATRFVAGETRETAIAAARGLNARGIAVSLDLLGENVTEAEEADSARDAYVDLLHGIAQAGVDANISIKLTVLGLDIAPRLAEENLRVILAAAETHGNWVRIDMEGSPYTQLTLEIFHRVWESYRNVGVVVQSMLRRTAADVERLIAIGARVRLVKGAYREPAPLAFRPRPRSTGPSTGWPSGSWTTGTSRRSRPMTMLGSATSSSMPDGAAFHRTSTSSRCCTGSGRRPRSRWSTAATGCGCTCPTARGGSRTSPAGFASEGRTCRSSSGT